MWGPTWADINLWLHIVAACVWIGGQLTLAALIPVVRGRENLPSLVGQRFQLLAWPAFGVLLITGIINVNNAGIAWDHLSSTTAGRTLGVKLVFVLISGVAAALHASVIGPRVGRAKALGEAGGALASPVMSGVLGGLSFLAALLAALYGVVIAAH